MNKRQLIALLLGVVLLAMVPDVQAQCAMCRASVESNLSTGQSTIGAGLNKGILFLLAMPYLSIGIVGYLWYRASKKNKQKQDRTSRLLEKMRNKLRM